VTGAAVDLYWLPLGAGGHSIRYNGRVYEAIIAVVQRRKRRDLYHAALQIFLGDERWVIEMAPAWDTHGLERGAVAEGPVGAQWAGRLRAFRYEIRRWCSGRIPDIDEAVDSPQRLSSDPTTAQRLLDLVPDVPTMTWGRDELHTGHMWNSNSMIAWLLVRSGIDPGAARMPENGRAPGWDAGLAAV
jgi:hypothetical protein